MGNCVGARKPESQTSTLTVDASSPLTVVNHSGSAELNVTGDQHRLTITSDKPIRCTVEGHVLRISTFPTCEVVCCCCCLCCCVPSSGDETGYAKSWALTGAGSFTHVMLSGSGGITTTVPLLAPNLFCRVSGSGDIHIMAGDLATITAEVLGSGDIEFRGTTCETASLKVSGSGDIEGLRVRRRVSAYVSGSGDITCHVDSNCLTDHRVSGSGDINFKRVN